MVHIILREEYRAMKWQWQSMTKTQEQNFSEFRERKHLIGKDNMKSFFFLLYCMYMYSVCYLNQYTYIYIYMVFFKVRLSKHFLFHSFLCFITLFTSF